MGRAVDENGCTVVGNWLEIIPFQRTLSAVHVGRGNSAVLKLLRSCLGTVIGFTIIGSGENLR